MYFIIEHQTKIDYTMPLRMLEYKIEVMRSATRGKNINNKNAKIPIKFSKTLDKSIKIV